MHGAQTLGGVIRRVQSRERLPDLARALDAAIAQDPMLRTIQHTGLLNDWGAASISAYMVLCLLDRARRAEARCHAG